MKPRTHIISLIITETMILSCVIIEHPLYLLIAIRLSHDILISFISTKVHT